MLEQSENNLRAAICSPESHNESSISISMSSSQLHDPSGIHSHVELPDVDAEGRLDWSGKGLHSLPKQKCTELAASGQQIRVFHLTRNSLRSVDMAYLPLDKCEEMDASENAISQLRSFQPLASSLQRLFLADNRINSLGALQSFIQLRALDLSHNRVEQIPALDDLKLLTSLKLDSNHLRAIPNLCRLEALSELSLHGNAIRTFANVNSLLPTKSLQSLDLGGNLVADLTEMAHLSGFQQLESLTVLGNICTPAGGKNFSYRPFVFSCVLGELKVLDGSCLSEQEIIKGEWLHAQGRSRSFRPGTGAHRQLCVYLAEQCPLVSAELQLANDDRLKKVIQKRREYRQKDQQATTTPPPPGDAKKSRTENNNPNSVETSSPSCTPRSAVRRPLASRFNTTLVKQKAHAQSPVSAVINVRQRLQKESIPPSALARQTQEQQGTISTSTSTSGSSQLSSRTVVLSKSEAHNNQNKQSNVQKQQEQLPIGICSPLTSRLPLSVARETAAVMKNGQSPARLGAVAMLDFESASTTALLGVTMSGKNEKKKSDGRFRSVIARKLRRSRAGQPSNSPESVRFQHLQKSVDQLAKQNSMLNAINEDHVHTFQQLTVKLQSMEAILNQHTKQNQLLSQLLVPTPANLTYRRVEGTNNVQLSWDNRLPLLDFVDHYDILLNDQMVQSIKARSKRMMITETNPEEELKISIQAVSGMDGTRSALSEIILPKRNNTTQTVEITAEAGEEGKENQR